MHLEYFGYLIGNIPVLNEVQVIKKYVMGCITTIQPPFCHTADVAARTMLKDDNGLSVTFVTDRFNLLDIQ